MNEEQKNVIEQCAAMSAAGTISFGDVVGRLMHAGVERYHADYSRMENTYYLPGGESHVVPIRHHESLSVAAAFSAEAVEASVRQAQRGEIVYPQFVRQTTAAGCGWVVRVASACGVNCNAPPRGTLRLVHRPSPD
jgi:uncharacterized protein YbcV (DUF1398 family)